MARRHRNAVTLGVAVGGRRDFSALCVVEVERCPVGGRRRRDHHFVRYLERLPAGTSFPELARRTGEIAASANVHAGTSPHVFVNVTGLGEPVVELFRDCRRSGLVTACYFTHGDRCTVEDNRTVRIGKAFLVAKLQAQLQTGRLHFPRTPDAESLAGDLLDYEIQADLDANDRPGAFRVGGRDELVTAVGLAVSVPRTVPGVVVLGAQQCTGRRVPPDLPCVPRRGVANDGGLVVPPGVPL